MRRALVLAGWLLAAGAAMAQQQTTLEPSAAVQCLSPPAAQRVPEFPFAAYKQHLNGRVQVQLRFTGPTLAPAVTVLAQEGDSSFVDAVRAHVSSFRVPCHASDQPVDLVFDFHFRPDQPDAPVVAPLPVDSADAARAQQLQCIENSGGSNLPAYPLEARREGVQGRVLVELRFEAPDKPPLAKLLPRIGGDAAAQGRHDTRYFLAPLRTWLAGYRMPCLQGAPVTVTQVYVFVLEGSSFGFKPGLVLRDVLRTVRDIRRQRLQFDFSTMGCPFDVALRYRQPNLPNLAQALGGQHPARQPFLDWLAQVQLDLPDKSLDAVYGDELKFSVPCLKIDLNPQE
jgi:hypothetical protein